MKKLNFKQFNSQQGLTKFVNDENIEPEEIASISSAANIVNGSSNVKVLFYLFYWVETIEDNKERDIEYSKSVDNFFQKRENKY